MRVSRSPPRDQETSAFTAILAALLGRVGGAYACALVDGEGETVDYCGDVDPFDVKVAAAHWTVVLSAVRDATKLGEPSLVAVRGAKRSYVVHAMRDGYALVLLLRRRVFTVPWRALSECEWALGKEAGWPDREGLAWHAVEVETDQRRRPTALCQEHNHEVTLLEVMLLLT